MYAKTFSSTLLGIDGVTVQIESSLERALPQIHITGLAGAIVRESRDRVRACLVNLGFDVPSSRILVSLSPANEKKQGSQFDLGIALSILGAEKMVETEKLSRVGFLGELSLDGKVRGVLGCYPLVHSLCQSPELEWVIAPKENSKELGVIKHPKIRVVESLLDVILFLRGEKELECPEAGKSECLPTPSRVLFDSIRGQKYAKRALQIALAGNHHLLLVGSPGVGKSMLAMSAKDLLPSLDTEQCLEVLRNYVYHPHQCPQIGRRPFRMPHHSSSAAAILGGGSGTALPGEVSLAHHGVLFLDEFPEFHRDVLEGLRVPLQTGEVYITRVGTPLRFPAKFTLIAAMNPCPCGYAHSNRRSCRCSAEARASYGKRVSGPLLDRIDLYVLFSEADVHVSSDLTGGEMLASIDRVRNLKSKKPSGKVMAISTEAEKWFGELKIRNPLSYRRIDKLIRVASTIAEIEDSDGIETQHLAEAWRYRCPESLDMKLH